MDPEAENARTLRALRDLVEDSDLGHATIEERAGFRRGYLTQVLGGHIQLKLWQVLAVLAALGSPAHRFFAELYPRRPATAPAGRPRAARPPAGAPTAAPALPLTRDVLRIYGFGLESLAALRRRLEACEAELAAASRDEGVSARLTEAPAGRR